MKNFKRTAVLSLLAIAFTFGVTSCGKANLKKDLEGSWTFNSLTQDGVDVYAQIGATVTGTYIFDKKAKKCTISITLSSPGNPDDNQAGSMSYKVKDKETILLEDEEFTVEELTSNSLVLSYSTNGASFLYYFTK